MSLDTATPAAHIEVMFLAILCEIQKRPSGNPKITLRRIVPDRLNLSQQFKQREVTYRWPGRNREEAWRFGTCYLTHLDEGSRILTGKLSMCWEDPGRDTRCPPKGIDDNKEVGKSAPDGDGDVMRRV
jgi:hypothetical protein